MIPNIYISIMDLPKYFNVSSNFLYAAQGRYQIILIDFIAYNYNQAAIYNLTALVKIGIINIEDGDIIIFDQ